LPINNKTTHAPMEERPEESLLPVIDFSGQKPLKI